MPALLSNEGDILRTIDVLAQEAGIIGLFSDWPATTTFYANCMGVRAGLGRERKEKRWDDDDRRGHGRRS